MEAGAKTVIFSLSLFLQKAFSISSSIKNLTTWTGKSRKLTLQLKKDIFYSKFLQRILDCPIIIDGLF